MYEDTDVGGGAAAVDPETRFTSVVKDRFQQAILNLDADPSDPGLRGELQAWGTAYTAVWVGHMHDHLHEQYERRRPDVGWRSVDDPDDDFDIRG